MTEAVVVQFSIQSGCPIDPIQSPTVDIRGICLLHLTVQYLDDLSAKQRLFTYKVMVDAGTAPNPFGGVCTLAICKPKIRTVAIPGDLIVGIAPGDEGRIVYCMQVTDIKSWNGYIDLCTTKVATYDDPKYPGIALKVPKSVNDQGDCIWRNAELYEEVRPTWSGHEGKAYFENDVKNGKNVLLSTKYWYFGMGDKVSIKLRGRLKSIIPGRGHRSNANSTFRDEFVRHFNDELRLKKISDYGVHGSPNDGPEFTDKAACARCRVSQFLDDQIDEET